MKVIFLDVDGVLNCVSSTSKCGPFVGIDGKKVKLLRKIIEETGAVIVLSSTWKDNWERVDKENQDYSADYLDRKLKREMLRIFDKTQDEGENRGEGILRWMKNREVEKFIILDDNVYDFKEQGLSSRHIQTEFYNEEGGINESHVDLAIEMLKN